MRLSAQIRKMLQSHPTHSQMRAWIEEAEKLEQRIEEAERRVEALQQRDLFEVREEEREREDDRKEKRAGVGS